MIRHALRLRAIAIVVFAFAVAMGVTTAEADAPPAVSIDPPSDVSYTSAQVSGTVNPNGGPSATAWHFEYTTEPSNPESWSWSTASGEISGSEAEGTSPIPVAGTIEFLQPNTEYFIRLVATNEEGANQVATEAPYPSFTTLAVGPPSVSFDPPSEVTGSSARFKGEIDPEAPAGNPEAFDVFWRFECTPSCPDFEGKLNGYIPAGSDPVQIDVLAEGLEPNTDYEVSLVAENAGPGASAGPGQFKTTAVAPVTATMPAFALGGGTAALVGGYVNPKNSTTTYWIEYGTDTSYGAIVPAIAGDAGSSGEPQFVSERINGLTPNTVYHYRLVAENGTGITHGEDKTFTTALANASQPQSSCPNEQFRKGAAARLPNCRAYEMVSPPDKAGTDIFTALGNTRVADDGSRVAFGSTGAFAGAPKSTAHNSYIAAITRDRWSTVSPLTRISVGVPHNDGSPVDPAPIFGISLIQRYSPDLRSFVLGAGSPNPVTGAVDGRVNSFLQADGAPLSELTKLGGVGAGARFPAIAAASRNFDHIVVESPRRQTPDSPIEEPNGDFTFAGAANVYEYVDGHLRLAAILPDGTPAPGGAFSGTWSGHGVGGAASGEPIATQEQNVISEDGSKIFWTSVPDGQVYARIDGASTVHVSASQRTSGSPEAERPGTFLHASADGSLVYFLSEARLTDDSTAAAANPDLYVYDFGDGSLTDLSVSDSGGPADVQGLLGASDDGETVYFAARPGLTGEGEGIPTISPGMGPRVAIYAWHNGSVRYLTTLSNDRLEGKPDPVMGFWSDLANWKVKQNEGRKPSRVSASGRHLLIRSVLRLTAYDNDGYAQLYRYDLSTDELVCLSCDRSGRPPSDSARIGREPSGEFGQPIAEPFETRHMTPDGSHVFFETKDPLLPADGNGNYDVYQWEGGRFSLLSTGTGESESNFLEASPSGDDVLIATRQQLSPWDRDQNIDIYDARVGGGLPDPPVAVPPCEGEACRGPAPAPPPPLSAASQSVHATGNAAKKKRNKARKCSKAKSCRKAKKRNRRNHSAKSRKADRKRTVGK